MRQSSFNLPNSLSQQMSEPDYITLCYIIILYSRLSPPSLDIPKLFFFWKSIKPFLSVLNMYNFHLPKQCYFIMWGYKLYGPFYIYSKHMLYKLILLSLVTPHNSVSYMDGLHCFRRDWSLTHRYIYLANKFTYLKYR